MRMCTRVSYAYFNRLDMVTARGHAQMHDDYVSQTHAISTYTCCFHDASNGVGPVSGTNCRYIRFAIRRFKQYIFIFLLFFTFGIFRKPQKRNARCYRASVRVIVMQQPT